MTPKEIAADFTRALAESGNGRVWAFVEAYMEQAIIAAVEEDRKTRECCKAAAKSARAKILNLLEMGDIAEAIRAHHLEAKRMEEK
jgi:hypothetical protein